ncbi:MAG: tetraacyldisaccharide 4'-kinase [Gammaproteobacteria bacterium]
MHDWRAFWRRRRAANFALLPFAALYGACSGGRRLLYRFGVLPSKECGAPVVVVGNITAGGGGKTPIVIALAAELQKRNWQVGIVSRGYGGNFVGERFVCEDDNWREVGDEPLLIKQKTGLPVCIGKNRHRAATMLAKAGCTMIISDDGLQHYKMARRAEVCAMRGDYLFGNGWHLPAGPLREGKKRASSCTLSAIVNIAAAGDDDANSTNKTALPEGAPDNAVMVVLQPHYFYHTQNPDVHLPPQWFHHKTTAAFAGTANPREFFDVLAQSGIRPQTTLSLPDHGIMPQRQLDNIKADAVLTTEKDALKYPRHARLYGLALRAFLPPEMTEQIAAAATTSTTT